MPKLLGRSTYCGKSMGNCSFGSRLDNFNCKNRVASHMCFQCNKDTGKSQFQHLCAWIGTDIEEREIVHTAMLLNVEAMGSNIDEPCFLINRQN